MLSNMIAQQVLGFFDDLYLHFTSLESSMIFVTFDEQISNLLGPNDVDFYMF
jgi:hypothetical protein